MTTFARELREVPIQEEMRTSYLDYAMSVIVARALPDVRDGLKPVQRRILYAMHELGLRPTTPHRKSARIVGEVLGKYHPHGDAPVYEALVRMAQPFTLRYPLIDGQGNFGSIDDDPPAAMRYTEARLAPIAEEMLADLDRDTVDFVPNFDGSLQEPTVLPTRLPNLLVNGASGIAVGMATSIPPHNLGEVCDALCLLIDRYDERHTEAVENALLDILQGPDFPTGGIILRYDEKGNDTIREAYRKGRGRILVQARVQVVEPRRTGRRQILITEIPYQVSKAGLVERIAHLIKEKKVDGVLEVRDESDREGLRVVLDLRRDADPEVVLNNLYEHTPLRTSFTVNLLALVNGQPRDDLSLRDLLLHFLEFRQEVVTRRARYDLQKARERAHILEGLRIALQFLDEVIRTIRQAQDTDAARQALMQRFGLTQAQAQAILEMQLRRLSALERERLEEEYRNLQQTIADLEALLADPRRVLAVVREEVLRLKEQYGDPRRTEISEAGARRITVAERTQHEDVVVILSGNGYIKRVPLSTYRAQRRGGKGVRGMPTREGDAVTFLLVADTHDTLLFFTDRGRVYALKVYELPGDTSRTARGTLLTNLGLSLAEGERVNAMVAVPDLSVGLDLLMATRQGEVKRLPLTAMSHIRASGLTAMDLEPGDALVSAQAVSPEEEVLLVTEQGMSIAFRAEEVPQRSRQAGGVRGIELARGDRVVAMDTLTPGGFLLCLTRHGYGKRTPVEEFRLQHRGGKGIRAFRISPKTGPLVSAQVVGPEVEDLVVVTARGQVFRTSLEEVSVRHRDASGVVVIRLDEGDEVASMACLRPRSTRAPARRG